MLNWKQRGAIAALCLAIYLPYFFYPIFIEPDSYHFLGGVCGKNEFESVPEASKFLFSLLPCDFLSIKVLLFTCFLFSTLFVAELGSLFNKKNGWLAGILVFLCPYWPIAFYRFEENVPGLLLCSFALWLFYLGKKRQSYPLQLASIGLTCFNAYFVWNGAAMFLLGFAFLSKTAFLTAATITIHYLGEIRAALFLKSSFLIIEYVPGIGLAFLVGLLLAFTRWGKLIQRQTKTQILTYLAFTILAAKWFIFLVPLLAISIVNVYETHNEQNKKALLGAAIGISLVFALIAAPKITPPITYIEPIQLAIKTANDQNLQICNDWPIGHMIEFYGGTPSEKGFGDHQYTLPCKGIMVTAQNTENATQKTDLNCRTLYEKPESLNVLQCNH